MQDSQVKKSLIFTQLIMKSVGCYQQLRKNSNIKGLMVISFLEYIIHYIYTKNDCLNYNFKWVFLEIDCKFSSIKASAFTTVASNLH